MLDIAPLPKKFTHTQEAGNFMFPQCPQVPTNLFPPTNINEDPHIDTYNRQAHVRTCTKLIHSYVVKNVLII